MDVYLFAFKVKIMIKTGGVQFSHTVYCALNNYAVLHCPTENCNRDHEYIPFLAQGQIPGRQGTLCGTWQGKLMPGNRR